MGVCIYWISAYVYEDGKLSLVHCAITEKVMKRSKNKIITMRSNQSPSPELKEKPIIGWICDSVEF